MFLYYDCCLGFCIRLGFLIDFLSHAALVGFMAGAAVTIALQQLKYFLGIKHFTKKTDIISVMHSVFGSAHHGVSSPLSLSKVHAVFANVINVFAQCLQWNWQTIVIGATFLIFLLLAKYIVRDSIFFLYLAKIL